MSLWICTSGTASSYNKSIFNLLRKGQNVFSTVNVIPTSNVISLHSHQCLQFSGFYVCLKCSHPWGCEVISHCSLNLHLPNDKWCSASLQALTLCLYMFWWNIYSSPLAIYCLFIVEYFELFICSNYWSLIKYMICTSFLPFCGLSSCFFIMFLNYKSF